MAERKVDYIGFVLSTQMRKQVERLAKKNGVGMSTIVRWALRRYLSSENGVSASSPQKED